MRRTPYTSAHVTTFKKKIPLATVVWTVFCLGQSSTDSVGADGPSCREKRPSKCRGRENPVPGTDQTEGTGLEVPPACRTPDTSRTSSTPSSISTARRPHSRETRRSQLRRRDKRKKGGHGGGGRDGRGGGRKKEKTKGGRSRAREGTERRKRGKFFYLNSVLDKYIFTL